MSLKNAFAALPDDAEVEMDVCGTPTNPAAATLAALFRDPSGEEPPVQGVPQPVPAATATPAPPAEVSTSKAAAAFAALFREPSDNMAALADAAPPAVTATNQPNPIFGFAASSPVQPPSSSSLWGPAPASQSLWQGMPTLSDSLGSFWNATPKQPEEAPPTEAPVSLVNSHPLTECPAGIVPERVEQFNGLARQSTCVPSRLLLSTLGAAEQGGRVSGDGTTQPTGWAAAAALAADSEGASLAAAAALLAREPSGPLSNPLNRCA